MISDIKIIVSFMTFTTRVPMGVGCFHL